MDVIERHRRFRSILSRVRQTVSGRLRSSWRWSASKLRFLASWNFWKEYWYLLLLVAVATWAGADGQLVAAWPYYACILIAAALTRFQEKNLKVGALCGALLAFAYVVFQAGKHTIVVAPFSLPSGSEATLPFNGTTVADVVRDGLINIGKVAGGEPRRFPCSDSPVTSDIARAIQPNDVSLQIEQLPVQANADAVAPEDEKEIDLEVKGISLKAVYSAARTVLHTERDISGDVVMAPGNKFYLVAQSDRGEGPWRVGPYPANLASLQQAGCQMAQNIYTTIDPNLLAKSYINTNRALETSLLYGEETTPDLSSGRDAHLLWSAASMLERNYGGSAKLLQQNVDSDPSDRSSHEALGMAYVGANNYDRAFAEFDKTLRCLKLPFRCPAFLLPRSVLARYQNDRGIAFYHKGNFNEALKNFQKAAVIRPNYVMASFFCGLTLEKLDRYEDATTAFSTTLNHSPIQATDAALIEWQLGNSYKNIGQTDKALAAYQASLSNYIGLVVLEPDSAGPYLGAGLTDLLIASLQEKYDVSVLGNKDKGKEILRQAVVALNRYLKDNPTDENTRILLAKAHAQRAALFQDSRDFSSALADYTQAIDESATIPHSNPAFDESRDLLGVSLVRRGYSEYQLKQNDKAVADAQKAIGYLSCVTTNDRSDCEWRARAMTLAAHVDVDAKRYGAAIEKLNAALTLISSFPEASHLLGIALFQQAGNELKNSQTTRAEENLRRAVASFQAAGSAESDTNAQIAKTDYFLAMILEVEKQYNEAANACREAIRYRRLSPPSSRLANNMEEDCSAVQTKARTR